jgi:Fic family protein
MDPNHFSRGSPGRVLRTTGGFWVFIPKPLPPSVKWDTTLIASLGEAERSLGRLASLADALPYPHILIRPFIRREAVLSSRIEGTRASLVDLYQYESAQLTFLEDVPDVREVHNYVRAMDYGLERIKALPVSLRLIREIHAILMEGVRGDHLTPGEFRR